MGLVDDIGYKKCVPDCDLIFILAALHLVSSFILFTLPKNFVGPGESD